jgi:membrane associated rhomboid family serine protease
MPTAAALCLVYGAASATVALPTTPFMLQHLTTTYYHIVYGKRYWTLCTHALFHGSWSHLATNALVSFTHGLRSNPGFWTSLVLFFGGAASGVAAFFLRHIVYAPDRNLLTVPLLGTARTGISPIDACITAVALRLREDREDRIARVRHIGGSAGAMAFAGWELVGLVERIFCLARRTFLASRRTASASSSASPSASAEIVAAEFSTVKQAVGRPRSASACSSVSGNGPLTPCASEVDPESDSEEVVEDELHHGEAIALPTPPITPRNLQDLAHQLSQIPSPASSRKSSMDNIFASAQDLAQDSRAVAVPSPAKELISAEDVRRGNTALLVDMALLALTVYNEVSASRAATSQSIVGAGVSVGSTAHVGGLAFGAGLALCYRAARLVWAR